jgi:Ca-activated chloride channel family protein
LNELARVGRGFARYFDPVTDDETLDAVASELAEKLHTPVLTDIFIDWNDLPVSDVSPARIPDLYAGETIRLTGRFDKPANGVLNIIGRSAQRRASLSSAVSLDTAVRPGLRQIWARRAVADQMHEFVMPQALRPGNATDQELQNAITDLGLTYGLATRWTAFVSVSRKRYNKRPGDALDADVALPKVAGVSNSAYPQSTFTGYGAPEPGEWLGLGVGLLTLLLFRRRLRAKNGNALT